MPRWKQLVAELRRRRVFRTALWYIGASVALVEAAALFLPALGAPAGITRVLAVLAVFGLPIALTLSWVFDVSTGPGHAFARFAAVGTVAVICFVGAFVVMKRAGPERMATAAPVHALTVDPAHVAVLEFSTDSDDPGVTAFARSLHTRLIDGLSAASMHSTAGTRRLRVISRASILPYLNDSVSLDSLRAQFKVGTVLDGSVEPTATGVRVRVRLIDTQTGEQLAVAEEQESGGDRLTLLDDLSKSVLAMIRRNLGRIVQDRMQLAETRSIEAFERFALATQRLDDFAPALARRDFQAAEHSLQDADSMFAAAERFDPDWLEPMVQRGHLATRRVRLLAAQNRGGHGEALLEGLKHADRALQKRPADFRGLELRGVLRHNLARSRGEAGRDDVAHHQTLREQAAHDLRAALVGNPRPARALRELSELAAERGHFAEALRYGERAYDEDPFLDQVHFTVFRLFEYSLALDRDAEAAKWCDEGRQRFPDYSYMFDDCRLSLAAWTEAFPLAPDSAWRLVAAELNSYPPPLRPRLEPRLHAIFAAILVRHGQTDSAMAVLRRAQTRDASRGVLLPAAGVLAMTNRSAEALQLVAELVKQQPETAALLSTAPELRRLRTDPRFMQAAPN